VGKSVTFNTNIGCRVYCKFCPQDEIMQSYAKKENLPTINFGDPAMMTYQTFVTMLKKVPKDVMIVFSGFTEPYLNPECGKMIQYASNCGYTVEVFSTLVGMTLEDVDILNKVKLFRLTIHLPDKEKYAKIALTNEFKQILKKIVTLPVQNTYFMTMGTVPEDIENIIGIKINPSQMVNWAGHIDDGLVTERNEGPLVCSMHEDRDNKHIPPIILPSGDVVLCCKDWSMEYILGNLLNCTFEELYQSQTYKEVVQKMASENDNVLCRNCEFAIPVNQIKETQRKLEELNIKPTDTISQKLNGIWMTHLWRPIDPEGLLHFYPKIMNNEISIIDVEEHVKNSPEYLSLPKKILMTK